MSRRSISMVISGIVAVMVIGLAVVWATNSNKSANTNTKSPSTTNQTKQQDKTTNSVVIKDLGFSPATITVKVGTKVTWTNNDPMTHTVTADNGNGPDSGNLASGKTYSFTFKTAGTYSYHCAIHPSMTGTVVVTE